MEAVMRFSYLTSYLRMEPYSRISRASEISPFVNTLTCAETPNNLSFVFFSFLFPQILQLSLERFSQTAETVSTVVQRFFNTAF
ncbi:hypothetical protein AB3S75_045404 [Citrus x aurantiifolia]